MGQVVSVLRYPLKSAQGESLDEAGVEPWGLAGDRSWACLDAYDGTVVSAKHPRRWGRLLGVRASLTADRVILDIAGRAHRAGTAEADAALSAHLGREVRLTRVVPDDARLHRTQPAEAGMVPEWIASAPGEDLVTAVAGARPGGRFVDYGPVHLVTTGALAGLAERLGRAGVPVARFRPNLVIDAARDPEPGQELRLGDVVLRVLLPTPRCAVPGLDPVTGATDRELLGTLARDYRVPVGGLGRAACFGAYAEVVQPGLVRVGQRAR